MAREMTTKEAIFTLQQAVDEAFGAGIEIITRGGCEAVEMAIEALKERKTGKWIEKNGMYICTACEHRLSKLAVYDVGGIYNYCPNCGAKMEGAEE